VVRLTRAQQQEQTHERLLDAGRAVFVRRGFLAATVEEVAAEAGYTRGAVYKHFGGKEGLWQAITAGYVELHLGRLRTALAAATTPAGLVTALLPTAALADPDMSRWIIASAEFLAAVAAQPDRAAALAAAQQRHDAEVTTLLATHCARLDITPTIPFPALVTAIGALGSGLALRHAVDPTTNIPALATTVLTALLRTA
jgi:AcrR family transcriptional regulator